MEEQPAIKRRSLLRRCFVSEDDRLRAGWRVAMFLTFGFALLLLASSLLHRYGEGINRGGWSAGLLLLSWYMLTRFDRRSFHTLGFWFYDGWWKEALWGLGLGVGLIGAVALGMRVAGVVTFARADASAFLSVLPKIAFMFLTAALFEELAFRGYPFQRLMETWGTWGAVAFFSAFFGFAHWNNPGSTLLSTVNTMLAGILLAQAYLKTRGLWLPLGLHWSWNFCLGPLLSLPVSGGKFEPALLSATVNGPQWLTGGNYGPEGSILLTAACTGAIVLLWRTQVLTPSPAMREVLQ